MGSVAPRRRVVGARLERAVLVDVGDAVSAPCFNCGAPASHQHHVVPRSLGGVATVPLCYACHGKAHGRARGFRDTNELTRDALAVKKARGESTGEAPYGMRAGEGGRLVADEAEQAVIARVRELRSSRMTVREIAAEIAAAGVVSRNGKAHSVSSVGVMVQRVGVTL